MKFSLFFAITMLSLLGVTGCMHTELKMAQGATFPPVDTAVLFSEKEAPAGLKKLQSIGSCVISGSYSELTQTEMLEHLADTAASNGANYVVYTSNVVPSGTQVSLNPTVISEETNNPNLNNSWGEINRDFDGGYSSVKNQNYGTGVSYKRVVRGTFYLTDEIFTKIGSSTPVDVEKNAEHQQTP